MNSKKAYRIILGIAIIPNTVIEIDAADNLNKGDNIRDAGQFKKLLAPANVKKQR